MKPAKYFKTLMSWVRIGFKDILARFPKPTDTGKEGE